MPTKHLGCGLSLFLAFLGLARACRAYPPVLHTQLGVYFEYVSVYKIYNDQANN